MALSSRALFALVLLVGVAGTGITVRLVNIAGYGTLGSLIWLLGYGTTIILLWYGWLRKMDITGQTNPDEIAEATEAGETGTETTDS
ncbi:MAG: hypothetical protein V5A45_04725 [Haloarculaceae archaeon]